MEMIKRVTVFLLIIITVGLFPPFGGGYIREVYGEVTEDNNKDKQAETQIEDIGGKAQSEIESLYEYINKMKTDVEIMQDLDPIDYIQTYIKEGHGTISFEVLAKAFLSVLFKEVRTVLKLCFSIVIIAVLCSLIKNLHSHLQVKVFQK